MTPEINYSVHYGGTELHYHFHDGQLIYKADDTEMEIRLDLRRTSFLVKQRRKFHRLWYLGLVLVVFPLWTLGAIYFKEGNIPVSGIFLLHWGFLAVGLPLLIFYHNPIKGYEVRTSRGDRLWIITDPVQPGGAEKLIEAVRQMGTGLS